MKQIETLVLRIDSSEAIAAVQSALELAAFEITFPGGGAKLIYGLGDREYVEGILAPLGFSSEPLYRLKPEEKDPNQPELFTESAK